MKNKFFKWWLLVIAFVPFILMFCLHISIALGNYFGININVSGVDVSDWFTFASGYLGGVMTLVGVVITLRYERNVQRYEEKLNYIEKERENWGRAICELNIAAPSSFYQQAKGILLFTNEKEISVQAAFMRQQLAKEMQVINTEKLKVIFFTDTYAMTAGCLTCKASCKIQTILPEFQKLYEQVGSKLYNVLQLIDSYVVCLEKNTLINNWLNNCRESNRQCQLNGRPLQYDETLIKEYESKIADVKPQEEKIVAVITEINNYGNNELQQLLALAKEYIVVRQQNVEKECFSSKGGFIDGLFRK